MGLFRRRNETLNERMLREAGLAPATVGGEPEPAPEPPAPQRPFDPFAGAFLDANSRATLVRPREWDALVTVDAELGGDEVEFAAVPDGGLIVDDDEERDLSPLADAVERELRPPYRARGVRQGGSTWAVSASRIEVVRMKAAGNAIDVAVHAGERTAAVDGTGVRRSFPELERLGERQGPDYAVHAERLDGDLWEVKVAAL